VLSQNLVFVSPPKRDPFGLSLEDEELEGNATGKDVSSVGLEGPPFKRGRSRKEGGGSRS